MLKKISLHMWSLIVVFGFGLSACRSAPVSATSSQSPQRGPVSEVAAREIVVSYNSTVDQVGYEILAKGGNAFDAFVAATMAQYVLAEGVTSPAGPLGALVYDAKTKTTVYLDATFNDPLDAKHKYDPAAPKPGQGALVPGAIAGLEALSKKYGKLSFAAVLEPAIRLATEGFPLSDQYAGLLKSTYGDRLKRSPYAVKTFFRDGVALGQGETLKLPVVAKFLKNLQSEGSKYVYAGAWAKAFVKEVNAQGGHISLRDFSHYKPMWKEPVRVAYRDYEIYSSPNQGGLHTLLSLKIAEQTKLADFTPHFTSNVKGLATLALIEDEAALQPWFVDQQKIDDRAFVAEKLSDENARRLWQNVETKLTSDPTSTPGTHSYQIAVVDKEGNAINGTNTIESFPWANDIFVEGIPISSAGELPYATTPGERRLNAFTMQFGFKDEKLRFTSGAFSASMWAAEFQFLVNIVDYKLSAGDVVSRPRFGSHAWDFETRASSGGIWLDPRVDKKIVEYLAGRGLKFTQEGYLDTGLGVVTLIDDAGGVTGAFAPLSSIGQSATKIVGIGVALDIRSDGIVFIKQVYNNSPAENAGLVIGDLLLEIQTNSVAPFLPIDGKSFQDVAALIKGPKGEPVSLIVSRAGVKLPPIKIVRDEVTLQKK